MEPELSSNWKKLQATLNQDSRRIAGRKFKTVQTQREQNSAAKRKRVDAQESKAASPLGVAPKRQRMGLGGSVPEQPKESTPSASLALWADDNDISAKDLVEAYGIGLRTTSTQGASAELINAGLSKDVEIGKYVAMDCEMVGVGGEEDRSVLARVSIVNFHGTQIYDSFVKPKEFVTDWRTHVSGISPKNMPGARSFEEVRDEVAGLLQNRVLIGHGIKHDLEIAMLCHPKRDIRDTARYSGFREYSGGRAPSLKKLAKEILGIDIQGGQHSSIEDARAAMLLFRRHKQAIDDEQLSRFTQRRTRRPRGKPHPKRNGKNKR